MQEFKQSAKRCVSGLRFVFHRVRKQNPRSRTLQLWNEASLNFVSLRSLRSIVKDREILSRVQMNALRAPLTVFPDLKGDVCKFSLDRADDFIDGINCALSCKAEFE